MGHNPRFRMWSREDWQGYCPTIGDMARRGWKLTAHCGICGLAMTANVDTIAQAKGRAWSPWGKSAKCRRLYCAGRMTLRGYSPRANEFVDI